MKTVNLNLGSSNMGICCPAEVSKSSEPKVYYPSFHYSGDTEMDLPDKGVILVKFHKTNSSTNTPSDGKKTYSCTLEIREIVAVGASKDDEVEAPAKNLDESGDALDAIMRKKMEGKKEKDDY